MNLKNLTILISLFIGLGILGYVLIQLFLPSYIITSWWRSPKHNEEVGGVWNSIHLVGLAYDVSPKDTYMIEKLKKVFPKVLTTYPNHVHCSWV